jgi:Ca2+-binding EF-hand superfamily protein
MAAVSAHAQDAAGQASSAQGQLAAQACATNWTAVDSDKNGKISEAEAQAATEAEFDRIDVDSNGTISVTEWKDCGDRSAYPGVPAGLDNLPREASSGAGEEPEGMTTSPASAQAEADLQIDPPETTGSIGSAGMSGWTDDDFTAADADKSGDLSAQEAASADRSRFDQSASDTEDSARMSSGAFAKLDADGDGMVSSDEFSSRDQAELRTGVEARFSTLDADGDNEVSREEFKNHRDQRFSEASQSDPEPTVWHYYYFVM